MEEKTIGKNINNIWGGKYKFRELEKFKEKSNINDYSIAGYSSKLN